MCSCVAFRCACSCVPAEVYAGSSYIWDFFFLAQTKRLRKAYVSGNHPKEQYFCVTKLIHVSKYVGFPLRKTKLNRRSFTHKLLYSGTQSSSCTFWEIPIVAFLVYCYRNVYWKWPLIPEIRVVEQIRSNVLFCGILLVFLQPG